MCKIKPSTLITGIIQNSFKGTIESFVANDNIHIHSRVQTKEQQHARNRFYVMC